MVATGLELCGQDGISCQYVNTPSGLRLRSEPSINATTLGLLPHGTQVMIIDSNHDRRDTIYDDGERLVGSWAKIKTLPANAYEEINEVGYLFDAYLSSELTSIPRHSLYNFLHLHGTLNHEQIDVAGITPRDQLEGVGCNLRFPYRADLKRIATKYFSLELLDENENLHKTIDHPYLIDTSWKPERFPLETPFDNSDLSWGQFYLPINMGKDSVLIKDNLGEWEFKRSYIGKVEALGCYLISDFPEHEEVVSINMKTGKSNFFSSGMPSISPHGNYVVSFYDDPYEDATGFALKHIDTNEYIEIKFTSWRATSDPIWIDNQSVIFTAVPYASGNDARLDEAQTIKLTLSQL